MKKKFQIRNYYSLDLWDYIIVMSHMPSRADRDKLVDAAKIDRNNYKRVQVWDFFFRVDPNQVGIPQRIEIETCRQEIVYTKTARNKEVSDAKTQARNQRKKYLKDWQDHAKKCAGLAIVGMFCAVMALTVFAVDIIWISLFSILLPLGFGLFTISIAYFSAATIIREYHFSKWRKWFHKECRSSYKDCREYCKEVQKRILALSKQIERLKRDIPLPCSPDQIEQWLNEDIKTLRDKAIKAIQTDSRLARIRGIANPFETARAPAELQDDKPGIYEAKPDLRKHLTARRYAELAVRTPTVLSGVYVLEFVLVNNESIGAYRCFWDLITGEAINELTAENYFQDIVSISTIRASRYVLKEGVSTSGAVVTKREFDDALTLVLSSSNGTDRQISFMSYAYLDAVKDKIGISLSEMELKNLVNDAEKAMVIVLTRIRSRLKEYKTSRQNPLLP